jgi:hypothetical protein
MNQTAKDICNSASAIVKRSIGNERHILNFSQGLLSRLYGLMNLQWFSWNEQSVQLIQNSASYSNAKIR